jgi:hypothetical protein
MRGSAVNMPYQDRVTEDSGQRNGVQSALMASDDSPAAHQLSASSGCER